MIQYTLKKHITDIEYNNEQLTVEYNFVKAERGYFDGTGTFDGVDLITISKDNVDITNLLHYDYTKDIERLVLQNHLNL